MAVEAQLVQVEIFGQTYRLRSEDDPDYVESLAAVVDRQMRDIARETNAVDSLKVAILAALNIADESRRGRAASEGGKRRKQGSQGNQGKNDRRDGGELDHRVKNMVHILDEAISS